MVNLYPQRKQTIRATLIVSGCAPTPNTPMDEIFDGMDDCYIDNTPNNPALVHLRFSLSIYPELQNAYRTTTNGDIAAAITPVLTHWGVHLMDWQIGLAMLCLGEISTALQKLALSRDPNYDNEIIDKMKTIFRTYNQARAARKSRHLAHSARLRWLH